MKAHTDINPSEMKEVFDYCAKLAKEFKNEEISGTYTPDTKYCVLMTKDNNVAFYCKEEHAICTYGLAAKKLVQKKLVADTYGVDAAVTRMVLSEDGA